MKSIEENSSTEKIVRIKLWWKRKL